jgi:hypothetical protein
MTNEDINEWGLPSSTAAPSGTKASSVPLRAAMAAIVVASVVGCAGTELGSVLAREHVTTAAALDHGCPAKQVVVEQEDTATWSYVLMVCGSERRYRDVAGKSGWRFVEVGSEETPAGH